MKCIVNNQVVLSRPPEGPRARKLLQGPARSPRFSPQSSISPQPMPLTA